MKKYAQYALLLIAFAFVFTSCKKKNELGRYIPANASLVVHMNAASLNKKLPWEEIKENEFFKTLYADSSLSPITKSALDNPENTGVDISNDITAFIVKDSTGSYMAVIGAVKDQQKFKTYNLSMVPNAKTSEANGVQYISRPGYVTSWDDKKFILVTDMGEAGNMEKYREMLEQSDSLAVPQMPEMNASTKDMVPVATAIYTLDEDLSLAENEHFGEMSENKGDLHFWVNTDAIYSGLGSISPMPMLNFDKVLKGAYTAATVNFENGFIKLDTRSYSGKEMSDLSKKYAGSNINSNMVKRIPAKDLVAFFSFNFKPEGIKAFLQLLGLDGLVNMGLAQMGFNLDDFVKANDGDIMIAVSGFKLDTTAATRSRMTIDTMSVQQQPSPSADFLFSASINNKQAFDKLITAGNQAFSQGMPGNMPSLFYNKTDKYFVIGNNDAMVKQYVTRETDNKYVFMDQVSASPFAGYINLQAVLAAYKPLAAKDTSAARLMDESLRIWDNVIMSGGNFENGAVSQHAEVNMLDKNTNSLKQLNAYTGKIGVLLKEKRAMNMQRNQGKNAADSVAVKK